MNPEKAELVNLRITLAKKLYAKLRNILYLTNCGIPQ